MGWATQKLDFVGFYFSSDVIAGFRRIASSSFFVALATEDKTTAGSATTATISGSENIGALSIGRFDFV